MYCKIKQYIIIFKIPHSLFFCVLLLASNFSTVHKCRSKYLVLEFSNSSWKQVSGDECSLLDVDIENKSSLQSFSCKHQGVYTVAFVSFIFNSSLFLECLIIQYDIYFYRIFN